MNLQIVRLYGLFLLLFGTLVAFTSYWSIFDAEELKDKTQNKRPLLEEQRIKRGTIRASDGLLLAHSEPQGTGTQQTFVRDYPSGDLFPHAVGYSFIDRGRTGIERSHNDDLVGEKAEFISILDQLRGRRQVGDNLRTNLDAEAQRAAYQGLRSAPGNQRGAVVAIEPDTGKVRVMASLPTYNPNQVQSDAEFTRLNDPDNPEAPLFNRATQSGYPPGSTMKVVTAAAALDSGEFQPSSRLSGKSPITISGAELKNFGDEQFGEVDLTTALTNSINTVWGQVGERLGSDTMYKYMRRFGFDSEPPMDYPAQQMLPSGVYQRGRILDQDNAVDIGRVAIGQERLRVTPLQMAMVAATVGNDGVLMKPRLGDTVVSPDGRTVSRFKPKEHERVMSIKSADQLAEMMSKVVKEGTGTAAALQGIDVAGKTGTAEVGNENQAWFIGFAPADNPRIAVAATVERTDGQGGTVAAPIAKQVMESLLK